MAKADTSPRSNAGPASTARGPVVVIDTREQTPLDVGRFLPVQSGTLQSGDYSVAGFEDEFSIERKSVPDLLQSLTAGRDRFERELVRLRGYRFRRLLIVGKPADAVLREHRRITPSSIFNSLSTYEARYELPVVWEPCSTKAARMVARWAFYHHREAVRRWEKLKPCDIQHAAAPSIDQVLGEVLR